MSSELKSGDEADLTRLLGRAVTGCWAGLPQEIQKQIFEAAVAVGAADIKENLIREQIALFLHEHHPRTEPPGDS